MLYNPTQLSESCKGYHRLLIYVLNIYPVEGEHFALPDMYGQVQLSSLGQASGITGPMLPETNLLFTAPPFRSS
ncbi:hypothetical protein T12_5991 [Trichinella patagoniensis]|uniref:Uncharacterized protein n=1 Tax=Trichinella patagoniensis TaxID=990121 RepID=A0A0V1AHT8_9BILA|nr:hypothetical protein T12_5991 [Trichinella patagoniensis]